MSSWTSVSSEADSNYIYLIYISAEGSHPAKNGNLSWLNWQVNTTVFIVFQRYLLFYNIKKSPCQPEHSAFF